MNCPKCGQELRRSEREPDYGLCDNCRKKFVWSENVSDDEYELDGPLPKPAKKKVSKKRVITASVLLGIIVAVLAGCLIVSNNIKKKKAREDTISSLESILDTAMEHGAEAETAGNFLKKVWYNTIYKKSDTETDKYTKSSDGVVFNAGLNFNEDFNTSLANVFKDTGYQELVLNSETGKNELRKKLKEIKKHPPEFDEYYDAAKTLYNAYVEVYNLIDSPNGSLQTYSDSFTSADNALTDAYANLKDLMSDLDQ